jgi:hypothetical protein
MSKSVCELASRFDARSASLRWLEVIESGATAYLESNPRRDGASHLKRAYRMARMARAAIERGNTDAATLAAIGALQAAWQAEIAEGRVMLDRGVTIYRKTQSTNATRHDDAERERTQWRKCAAAIRKTNPRLSKIAVARRIDSQRWNTVRRHI